MTDEPCDIKIKLLAFNLGFRSIAILEYKFLVNDIIINFSFSDFYQEPGRNDFKFIRPENKHKLPHVLKEGEITFAEISVGELSKSLKNRKFEGNVNLLGYYVTADKKKYWSKPLKFNVNEWDMC